jgi:hypothetical protein
MRGPAIGSEPKHEGDRGPTRREFLSILAGAGASLAIEPLKADTAREGGDWQEIRRKGIEFLWSKSWSEENEQVSFFVRKGGSGYWIHFGKTGTETYSYIPLGNMEELLKDNSVSIEAFHTHPLHTIMTARGIFPLEGAKPEPMPMPPSFADVVSTIAVKQFLGEKASRVTESVVDPVGTWHFETDPANPFIEKLSKAYKSAMDAAAALPDSLRQEMDLDIKKFNAEGADPRFQVFALYTNMDALSPELRLKLREIFDPLAELFKIPACKGLIEVDTGYAKTNYLDESERKRVIEIYKKAGVLLSFTPHSR